MSVIDNKYLDLKLHAKNGNLHDTLSRAVQIAKVYGNKITLTFPKGYFIEIWPDSTLNDIKTIEELTARLHYIKSEQS
ncbi:hypothetical protein CQS02_20115 [Elizabethkingia miricola]|nr:hypothetical protein CQS02_20115 [Elizabethkingia miricola]